MLTHEKLEVYGVAKQFFGHASSILEELPRGHAELKDQLNRAATSILLNIAEGAGRTRPKDKSHFYVISRGSALESAAVYDALETRGLIGSDEAKRGKHLVERIVCMLTKMIRFD